MESAVSSQKAVRLPELLSPAGDWECVRAAVENGADAVYFGLDKFNARMRAANFTQSDLPKLMAFLHGRGVRGYVTFNTLVFTRELPEAERFLRSIISAGVDAAIVQDVGLCRLIRRLSPDFPIHASTQMTISSAAGVEFARDLGCEVAVLARECSLKEIESIQAKIGAAGLPLEIFVHGALCVAYSGQCLTSESLGGRSANRGECAQACRMPYELVSDGVNVPLGHRKYLLSPQDLAGLDLLPQIIGAGVTSLKIEGRLKTPEYVANITAVYRKALDLFAEKTGASESDPKDFSDFCKQSRYPMGMAFSRGLETGWLGGIDNQRLVNGTFAKKRGVLAGTVVRVERTRVSVRCLEELKPGDGVVFDSGSADDNEQGGRIYQVDRKGEMAWLGFGSGDLNLNQVHAGDRLWKTNDPALDRSLRQSFDSSTPRFARPVHMEIHGRAGEPLTLIVEDELGNSVKEESASMLQPARTQPLTPERLQSQLGRLGGTPFRLESLTLHLDPGLILPVSELNDLRRKTITQLIQLREAPKRWTLETGGEVNRAPNEPRKNVTPRLIVLVRNLDQLGAALASRVESVYCEFEDPKKYREAVRLARERFSKGQEIWVAPPRITKEGETWILDQVRSSEPDGFLIRNFDHLQYFANDRKIGDFSLNVANPLTANYFLERFRLERVTASYDLNVGQLEDLVREIDPRKLEITLHQHMPMFHMEHCVFCAFLSKGTDYRNCGRPCDKHAVSLRDRVGQEHPLKADAGCRNTVFNAKAQTGAESFGSLRTAGATCFRIEFLNEPIQIVAQTIEAYRSLFEGKTSGSDLWRELNLLNQLGVTRGQLNSQRDTRLYPV